MGRKKYIILSCVCLFCIGVISGVFNGTHSIMASTPEGEVSGGEQPASVYYDEHWRAIQAYVATETGYNMINPASKLDTPLTGIIATQAISINGENVDVAYVSLQPDMVITKWEVHGHIHFE
jgi:hypothetical protein